MTQQQTLLPANADPNHQDLPAAAEGLGHTDLQRHLFHIGSPRQQWPVARHPGGPGPGADKRLEGGGMGLAMSASMGRPDMFKFGTYLEGPDARLS